MTVAQRVAEQGWTAERFLTTDQHEFGDAWRYELVDGRIVAHAAQSPEHGAILAGLTTALGSRLRGNPDGCRPESGSGAVPRSAQRATARIPDALIRCGEHPKGHVRGDLTVGTAELDRTRCQTGRPSGGRGRPGDRRTVPVRAGMPRLPPPARRHLEFRGAGRPRCGPAAAQRRSRNPVGRRSTRSLNCPSREPDEASARG